LAGLPVAGEAHADRLCAGVVDLVVEAARFDGQRLEPGGRCFLVAQAGAGDRELEDLDHLRSE
jgi:hypothetical protein